MDVEEELLQMNDIQRGSPVLYEVLLENLRSQHYAVFKSFLKRGLNKRPASININHVYPYPLNKTLLDVACTEGFLNFVQLLLNHGADPNKINQSHGRAPVHFAAESGHYDVIDALLADLRTNPNLEVNRETALHFAVRKNYPECAKVLLKNNSSPNIPNSKGVTPLHLAATIPNREMVDIIMQNSRLPPDIDSFRDFRKRSTRDIMLEKFPDMVLPPEGIRKVDFNVLRFYLDANDETHFLENFRKIDENELGDGDKELLVICAQRNFRTSICELMKRREIRGGGPVPQAALEAAVMRGHYEVLGEFLKSGVKIDSDLILIASRELGVPCLFGTNQNSRLKCLTMLLDQPDINVCCEDDKGNTPLHYAARAEDFEAVRLLLNVGSYIGHTNIFGVPPIAHIPPNFLSDYLDSCLRSSNDRTDDYEIEFDYKCLIPHSVPRSPEQSNENFLSSNYRKSHQPSLEMEPLRYISKNPRLKHLLKHPVLSSFLSLKWHRIRQILYANFIFYVFFYLLLNCYVLVMTFNSNIGADENSMLNDSKVNASGTILSTSWQMTGGLWTITTSALILLAFRELLQFLSSPVHYIKSFENWLEVILIFLGTAVLGGAGPEFRSVVILLSAWELVILIGQHPKMSTSIEMFKTVTMNFMKFLFLYAFLIVAFALAFFTLFKDRDEENFPDPVKSLFKTIIMLTGEFEAGDIVFDPYPLWSRLIFVLFIFLIAIVLFNLLNGLAVSDTADILGTAELVGLISRTKLISYAEQMAVGRKSNSSCNCCLEVPRCHLSLLGFMSRRLILFPHYLPFGKLGVKPYKNNNIRIYGRNCKPKKSTTIIMDGGIVERAREILSKRNEINEGERVMTEFERLNQRINHLETILEGITFSSENNNTNSDKH